MRTNTQEAVLSAYIASIGKRTPRDSAQDAAELCRLATSLNRLNEIACNSGLTERQERRKQNLSSRGVCKYKPRTPQTRIKAVLERAGLVLNTSTAIREATPCTSICPMALITASADGNAV